MREIKSYYDIDMKQIRCSYCFDNDHTLTGKYKYYNKSGDIVYETFYYEGNKIGVTKDLDPNFETKYIYTRKNNSAFGVILILIY